jgi:hypothetical protein
LGSDCGIDECRSLYIGANVYVKTQLFKLVFIYLFLARHLHTSVALTQAEHGAGSDSPDDLDNWSLSADPSQEIILRELYTVPFLPLVRHGKFAELGSMRIGL